MKTTLIKKKLPAEIKIKYPCLMRYINTAKEVVILARETRSGCLSGMVVHSTDEVWKPGFYREDWYPVDFKPLPQDEVIKLEN